MSNFWEGFDKQAGTMGNAFAAAAKKIGKAPPVVPSSMGSTMSGMANKAKNAFNGLSLNQKLVGAAGAGAVGGAVLSGGKNDK